MSDADKLPQPEITVARALEIVLSSCKMDRQTERVLKEHLAWERKYKR